MADFNQDHIKHFRFKELFNELGWDFPQQQQPYSVDAHGCQQPRVECR